MRLVRHLNDLPHDTLRAGSVVTIGAFDGLHLGHRELLDGVVERARAHGLPSVVMSFEPTPGEFFRRRYAAGPADALSREVRVARRIRYRRFLLSPIWPGDAGYQRRCLHTQSPGSRSQRQAYRRRRRFQVCTPPRRLHRHAAAMPSGAAVRGRTGAEYPGRWAAGQQHVDTPGAARRRRRLGSGAAGAAVPDVRQDRQGAERSAGRSATRRPTST